MINLPSIFEAAIADVIIQHAEIEGDFPRIRTWRAIDADGKWKPSNDRVMPVIAVTASSPEIDEQSMMRVAVSVGAMTDASDDQDHRTIAGIEAALQECLDALESQYISGGPHFQTFAARIATEMAGADYTVSVGGITHGSGQEPALVDGTLAVAMEIGIHYHRSNR